MHRVCQELYVFLSHFYCFLDSITLASNLVVFGNRELTSRIGFTFHIALALAMSRDGSSGGVIRMAIITEQGVERIFVPGDKLPGMLLVSCTRSWIYGPHFCFLVHFDTNRLSLSRMAYVSSPLGGLNTISNKRQQTTIQYNTKQRSTRMIYTAIGGDSSQGAVLST